MATEMTDEEVSKKPNVIRRSTKLVFFICFNWEGSPRRAGGFPVKRLSASRSLRPNEVPLHHTPN